MKRDMYFKTLYDCRFNDICGPSNTSKSNWVRIFQILDTTDAGQSWLINSVLIASYVSNAL